jgi:hypothetical protein
MPKKNNQKNKQKGGFLGFFEKPVDASGNAVTAAPAEQKPGFWDSLFGGKNAPAAGPAPAPVAVAPAAPGPAPVAGAAPTNVAGAPTTNVAGAPVVGGKKRNKSKKSKKSKKNRSKKH